MSKRTCGRGSGTGCEIRRLSGCTPFVAVMQPADLGQLHDPAHHRGLDIVQMHELVSALHSASREDQDYGVAFARVAESAANIVNAFNATAEAAGKIGAGA